MKEEIIIAKNKLRAALDEPLKYISIETDNASPQENEVISRLIEDLNVQRELSYYLPIYKAAKDFVTAWVAYVEANPEVAYKDDDWRTNNANRINVIWRSRQGTSRD